MGTNPAGDAMKPEYEAFLASKQLITKPTGMAPYPMRAAMFDFQAKATDFCLRRGKPLAPSVWIAVGLCALLFAAYQAWNDQRERADQLAGVQEIHRHVNPDEAAEIKRYFAGSASQIPVISICWASTPEAQRYAEDFVTAFQDAKMNATNMGTCAAIGDHRGLFVGLKDKDHPSDAAAEFLKRLLASGFQFRETVLKDRNSRLPADFDLFVAEAPRP